MTHPSHVKDELSKILAIRKVEPEIISVFGDLLRGIVPEIVEKTLELSPKCNCCKRLSSIESRRLELKFLDKISTLIFTGQKIKGEGASVRVALYDCLTGAVVKSGREANTEIEVVVLKGESDGDGGDNLTAEDFERKIVKAIKGNGPLLKGKARFKLEEGCCDIGEISFIHNSGWVTICQLSLAARVVGSFPGTAIQPAMTEYFMLKDRRNGLYGKKYPPALSDEVWRLDGIDKKGAFRERLKGGNVESVEDFLKLLVMDPESLKSILCAGPKTWETITKHASTCLIDESVQFCYYSNPEHRYGVIFNVVGKLKGVLRQSQYVPVDVLSAIEKVDAHKLVKCAFQNGKELTPYNVENSFMKTRPPFSGSLGLENPSECTYESLVTPNTSVYARHDTSTHANIPSISCVGESSRPYLGHFHSDASMDFYEELLRDPGLGFDDPIYSPETAHHDAMLLQYPNIISNYQSEIPSMSQGDQSSPAIVLVDTQDVSNIDVLKRWRRLLIVLNAIVTVKSFGATGRFHKKRKISSLVH
ncbi:calmodulin-binding protein 60 A-like [Apium graveolens]|uniref:calmodulin-binding protein 60 A-like n=1 Tax=Apium graveolens TaxID=4045 RepID=UPI003D79A411